jgi:Flp pilus assembly secretin CpaC
MWVVCSSFTISAEKSDLLAVSATRIAAMTFDFAHATSLCRTLGLGLVVATAAICSAKAEDLIVKYDQSQLLRLPRPAAEIIIGNPAIADISVQAGNLLVVTGKTFGITNIIALDADRNVIQDQRILVRRDEAKVVNLQRGTQRQSYNCTPQCNPSITIGDEQAYFDTISKASTSKIGLSERAADSSTQANTQ